MGENSRDGIRRYEDLIQEVADKAEQAYQLALTNAIADSDQPLGISRGGTGSTEKVFVDTYSDQFEIFGQKIYRSSAGFQLESDVVDSGELAGNIRLISCNCPAKDVGPQLRFSGRSAESDYSAFAFATIAGRKENDVDGDKSGYIQFATTDSDGVISELMRGDSEGNVLIGTGEVSSGLGNRLWVSGGDVYLDSVGGNREYRVQSGQTFGRFQSMVGFSGDDSEHSFISQNVQFQETAECGIDSPTAHGSCAIELRVDGDTVSDGTIRFYTGEAGECPGVRGIFSKEGLDVYGDVVATNHIIAGSVSNAANAPGNATANISGFVTGDNVKFGAGSPEGYVYAPIGAIYGRSSGDAVGSDEPTENDTLWVKVFNDGGNTGWLPVSVGGESAICVQRDCPEIPATSGDSNAAVPDCRVWFDTSRNIQWYYDPDVVRSLDPLETGAWVSVDIFQLTVPIIGRSHTQQFRGNINKDYEYLTPVKVHRQAVNMYLLDLTAAVRVARNSSNAEYSLRNYYTFDLVTLERRQGDPVSNRSTRQEWPGDREPYENKRDNLRGDGHTIHNNLSDSLTALSSTTPDGPPADGSGTVTQVASTRRNLIDSGQSWVAGQWRERDNDDGGDFPANNGYRVTMVDGAFAGVSRTIRDNTSDTLILRRPWPTLGDGTDRPAVGDAYEILDSQHKRIIARVSTKGNVWPDGAHVDPDGDRTANPPPLYDEYKYDDAGNLLTRSQVVRDGRYITRDVQDFVTSVTNGLEANNPGGRDDDNNIDPLTQYIKLDHYINILGDDQSGDEPVDAVVLAGLWDSVRRPGRITGVISVTYRMCLPPDACSTTDPESV